MRAAQLVAIVVVGCASCGPRAVVDAPTVERDAAAPPSGPTRYFALRFYDAPIGYADDTVTVDGHYVRIDHHEHIAVRRGDVEDDRDVTVEVRATRALVPIDLRLTEQRDGAARTTHAVLTATGWLVDGIALPDTALAVPSELVPLLVTRDGRFDGPVLLAGRGFAIGHGTVEPAGAGHQLARTIVDGAVLGALIDVDAAGEPVLVVDDTGVSARLVDRGGAMAPFARADVLTLGALTITGTPDAAHRLTIRSTRPMPVDIPGQRVRVVGGDRYAIEPAVADGDDLADLRRLTHAVYASITPSLAAPRDGSGDCTAYAIAVVTRAMEAGIPARLVTGFAVDGNELWRHRWAVAWTGTRWIAIDASVDEAPVRAPRLGLLIHDASAEALVAAELAFTGVSAPAWLAAGRAP